MPRFSGPHQRVASNSICSVAHLSIRCDCDKISSTVRRLRALVLLGVMLAAPGGAVAALVSPASQNCCRSCCGPMCQMNHHQKSQHGDMPCHGSNSSHDICMCSSNQTGPALPGPFTAEKLPAVQPVALPGLISHEVAAFIERTVLVRPVSPPDQPPRL